MLAGSREVQTAFGQQHFHTAWSSTSREYLHFAAKKVKRATALLGVRKTGNLTKL